jgi:hypothetical protein
LNHGQEEDLRSELGSGALINVPLFLAGVGPQLPTEYAGGAIKSLEGQAATKIPEPEDKRKL